MERCLRLMILLMVCGLYSPGKTFLSMWTAPCQSIIHLDEMCKGILPCLYFFLYSLDVARYWHLSINHLCTECIKSMSSFLCERHIQVQKNHLLLRRHDSWCSSFYPNDGHAMPLFTSLNQWNTVSAKWLRCTARTKCLAELTFYSFFKTWKYVLECTY